MKRLKRVKSLIAGMLCLAMAVSPVTAFADTPDAGAGNTSILAENFDELKAKAEELAREHEAQEQNTHDDSPVGAMVRSYASARSAYSFDIDLSVGKAISYNGYMTHDFKLSDGTTAFCLEPSKMNPSSGGYTATESGDPLLRAVAYYGFGGPGYEEEMGMYNLLDPSVRPYAYVLTHMALSYVYDGCSDDTDAFKGTNAGTVEGIKQMVSTINNFAWMVPSGYGVFTFGGGSAQTMGFGGFYRPQGKLQLQKVSADPSITDGNSCYSLAGAEYGVYRDGACTDQVATLTTDAAGNSNVIEPDAGDYWVKETKAPKGFALDETVYHVTVSSGQTATLQVTDLPQSDPVSVLLGKIDKETNSDKPQGSASLAGAEFTVRYYDGVYDTDPAAQGIGAVRTWVLRTDENGYCRLDNAYKVSGDAFYYSDGNPDPTVPIGTITIQETKAPAGYLLNSEVFVCQITSNSVSQWVETYNQPTIPEQVIRGGVRIQKRDAETGEATAQGSAVLSGGEYAIINRSVLPVFVGGKLYATGETVMTIVTDANGVAQTAADALPSGDYLAREVKAPAGYQLSGVLEQGFSIRENGVIVDLTDREHSFQDPVIRGGVMIQKRDLETGAATPMGGATLEGAEFGIYNRSKLPVLVDGKLYANGEKVMTITTNRVGLAQTTADALPCGDYRAKEEKSPAGYLLSGVLEIDFSIRENGKIVDLTDKDHSIKDQVKRGDFELRKIDSEYQDSMPEVQFEITQIVTGECHRFTTDENGYYSSASSWNPHSSNTNGGGAEDGLWFGETTGGDMAPVDDSLGALPEGDYLIDEIESYANAGKEMLHLRLHISRDGYTVTLGNVENEGDEPPITITTQARDAQTDSQIAQAGTEVTIVDTVTLEGVIPKREYTVKGTLMDRETGEALTDAEGKKVTAELTFKATAATETVELTFHLDGSALAGKTVVAFEKCFYRRREVAAHENINDPAQAVYFPLIETELTDVVTGSHTAEASSEMTLTDAVPYHGLKPGVEYTMSGILMDKDTEKELLIDGKPVTAEETFTPERPDGVVELTFTFDGSALGGKSVVAFEDCLYEGKTIAVHHDLDSEEQTVHIPKIETELKDVVTGSHTAEASSEMKLVDAVPYYNLIPGITYTMSGKLMDKETGKELLIDGKPVTAEETFTPERPDGVVELTFTFDGSALEGKSVVAFEDCLYEGKAIAVHHDLDSEEQTVHIPKIETELTDVVTGSHTAEASSEMKLVDAVPYYNLIPGISYTMSGILMDKDTGKELLIDGKPVTAEETFTPERPDGVVELTFTFDGSALGGKSVVAFEDCFYEGKTIAVHHDLDCAEQTVDIVNPPEEPQTPPERPQTPPIVEPKTGDRTPLAAAGILCVLGAGLLAAAILGRRARRK